MFVRLDFSDLGLCKYPTGVCNSSIIAAYYTPLPEDGYLSVQS